LKIKLSNFKVSHLRRICASVHMCEAFVQKSKGQYREILQAHVECPLQQLHCALAKYAVSLLFQGMDRAGKDGAIRHVISVGNPEGCEVYGCEQPSDEELRHDFPRRTTCRLPERGPRRDL
jgi:polyphosphate kinase 2 (PPK2 family)